MHCWVCDREVERFLPYGVPARPGRCPICDAKPRTRTLKWLFENVFRVGLGPESEVLEVGPSKVNARMVPRREVLGDARYTAIDVRALDFHAEIPPPHRALRMDVTALDFASASFDLVLCNNTLPYVRDDAAALREIRRCLKPNGVAMIDTHRDGATTRTAVEHRRLHPHLDDAYFAENGDQWVYGDDFLERIEQASLLPRAYRPFERHGAAFLARNGLKAGTECLLAFHSDEAAREILSRAPGGRP